MRKVLIIMERDCLRDALERELRQDFEVLTCGNADDGAVLLQDRPDMLVLDLFLPGTDGLTFLIRNQSRLPSVVIVLSTFTSSAILQQLAELGVEAVIRKPCTIKAITSALKTCV